MSQTSVHYVQIIPTIAMLFLLQPIFFSNFDLLLEAPNSIQKLREMILQLAVQGKLVPQDPNDEPASELLKKIKAEKEKLIAEGKIKKEKTLPPIKPEQIPFELPRGWEWIRLGDVSELNPRNYIADDLDVSFIPMNLIYDGFRNKHFSEIRKWGEIKSGFTHFRENDVVVAKITPCFQNRKSVVMKNLINHYGAGTTELYVIRSYNGITVPEFLLNWFKTDTFIQGGVRTFKGTAGQQRVEKDYIERLIIGLPPYIEQKRIIAKVDELMKLCDELEIKKQKAEKERVILNNVSLDRLTFAKDLDEFSKQWTFVSNNFNLLYDVTENINKLRQVILQLAVQGKLVPQDPNDEPASELLKRIKVEKERLVAEGKIKKEKLLPPIKPEEIPYKLPKGWEWVRLPEIVRYDSHAIKRGPFGSAIKKEFFVSMGYKVYEQRNAIYDDFKLGNYYINEDKFEELRAFEAKPFDIIISCSGTIGKVAIAPEGMDRGIINQALLKITLNQDIMINKFFKIIFTSFIMQTKELSDLRGTAMKNITSINVLKELPLPLPPLQEQLRILKKIELLMNQCDGLESQLQKSQKDSGILMQAVLQEAFQKAI